MTDQEATALIHLLQRTPMSQAESLWCQALLDRLRQGPPAEGSADAQDHGQRQTSQSSVD